MVAEPGQKIDKADLLFDFGCVDGVHIKQKGNRNRLPFCYILFGSTSVISYDTGISACPGAFGFCGFTLTFAGFPGFSRVMFSPWMSNNFLSLGLHGGGRRQDKVGWKGRGLWVAK